MTIKLITGLALALTLTACAHSTQMTSGADYLDRYAKSDAYRAMNNIDVDIYEIAAIEPDLRFPARIGLARIGSNGNKYHPKPSLTSIPSDEAEIWADLVAREGHRYGEFVPVSPLIAAMVSPEKADAAGDIVAKIRKGAARQHLDYVLVYEVSSRDKRTKNDLGFTDATVLGLFLVPSRKVSVDTIASAVLIDVRNGYPYAAATSFAENRSTTTKSAAKSKRTKMSEKGRVEAIEKLSVDVQNALQDLKDKAYEQLVAEGY